jgi:DNA polymerase III gamma/tau subunit
VTGDGVGIIEPHEHAITIIASTKDKKVKKTFLSGFMTFSFQRREGILLVIVQHLREN